MTFFDIERDEICARKDFAARRLLRWYESATASEVKPSFAELVAFYDAERRYENDGFLNSVSSREIDFISPTLRPLINEGNLEAIMHEVRTARTSMCTTQRLGTVETSIGYIYWGINKPLDWAAISRALRGRPFSQLQLWHPLDVNVPRALPAPQL